MTPLHVQWSQIEAECDGYREGFVAIYRKYEGMPTDEKDAQGKTIRVTQASFARHMKIPESTFKNWMKRTKTTAAAVSKRDRTREAIDRMPTTEKAELAAELLEDPEVANKIPPRRFTAEPVAPRTVLSDLNDELQIDHRIQRATSEIREATNHARNITLTGEDLADALEAIRNHLTEVAILADAIDTDSFNDELATLLGGNQ